MKLGRALLARGPRALPVLVIAVSLALGCEGKSEGGGGDESESGTGGSGNGGTSGFGGTSGASTGCVAACQRGLSCPDAEPQDCTASCATLADEWAGYGCTPEFERYFDCVASVNEVCSPPPYAECENRLTALTSCQGADPTMSGCTEDAPAPNTTCEENCGRAEGCANVSPDCVASCHSTVAEAAMHGCSAAYQRYLDCVGSCRNLCAITFDDCRISFDAYIDCRDS